MSTTINRFNELIADYEAKIKVIKAAANDAFKKEFKGISEEIFTAYPDVKALGWTQYTPYFNDGDACVFGYGEMHVCFGDSDPTDTFYDWEDGEMYGDTKKKFPLIAEFNSVLSRSEDMLLEMFGDHVSVTVTPEGIQVDEYEHD